jgi:hypothetical protein
MIPNQHWFRPTKIITIIRETTKLFFHMWVKHYGIFEIIMNDCVGKCTSKFWIVFMKKIGTKLKFNMTFHLQVNG